MFKRKFDSIRTVKSKLSKLYGISETAIVWCGANRFILVIDYQPINIRVEKQGLFTW